MEIKLVNENYYKEIIDELRKEYGVKRKGDTYMSEERLQQIHDKYKNKELEVVGLFDEDKLLAFSSYKITEDGLYGGDILVFKEYRKKGYGEIIVNHLLDVARSNNCSQMYFGARRSANNFYYKLGFEGVCLIQSSASSKEDILNILKKYNINEYSYNLYNG